ncbi:MAG TPA: DUF58 domain-containing protein [Streptosporangiaceae bacterium]|nr:DUF58 domain-containing protein [Streptosporangiaceae bacterium]
MRSVLAWFTVRGASFLTAGAVGVLAALLLGSDALVSVGAMLIFLPLLSALTARRARYQLRCERVLMPSRVAPGQAARVAVRLENISRISTGLLLAEETIPYSLGARPRYVINGIERAGSREVSYQLRSDVRGKFPIGPMRIRIADVFGLVELTANFASTNMLTVTPKVIPLTSASVNGSWSSDGDGRTRMTAAAGDDDVIPRAYRVGDELRRVHWRSTARYGELMVRREEQRWQDRAVLILDTRRASHTGSGPNSSFEFAVSAAASIGVHLARSGLDGHLLTDSGPLAGSAMFEDVLLDALSVVGQSRNHDFARTTAALSTIEGGLLVLIAGRLSAEAARDIASTRREGRQGIALLLAVSTWSGARQEAAGVAAAAAGSSANGQHTDSAGAGTEAPKADQASTYVPPAETATAEAVLRAAGWRVVTVDAGTPLAVAWQRLPRLGSYAAQGGLPNLGVVTR